MRRTHPPALRRPDHGRGPRLRRQTDRSARLLSRQTRIRLHQPGLPRPAAVALHAQRRHRQYDLIQPHASARPACNYRICYCRWRDEWDIYQSDEVGTWPRELQESDPKTADLVDDAIYTLSRSGPALGRPLVDTITNTKIANLKGLGPCSRGRTEVRILSRSNIELRGLSWGYAAR